MVSFRIGISAWSGDPTGGIDAVHRADALSAEAVWAWNTVNAR